MPDRQPPADRGTATDFHLSQEPVTPPVEAPAERVVPAPAYEYLGELPADYGASNVYLVAYDPHRLFVYWDLDPKTLASIDSPLTLRVCQAENGSIESQLDLGRAVSQMSGVAAGGGPGRYLPVTHPGTGYYVELGAGGDSSGSPWRRLAVSSHVVVPPEGLAVEEDGDARFATLPFHLSFQRLADLLRATVHVENQLLTEALANLKQEAHATPADAALIEALNQLDGEQRRNLETALGWEFSPSSPDSAGTSPAPTAGGSGGSSDSAATRALLLSGVSSLEGSGGLTSAGVSPSSVGIFSARAALGSEAGRPSSGAFAAGLSSAALFGARGAGASGIFGPAPSSEAWRRAVAAGAVAGSGGSDQFVRERAERFLRAITSSLDVLSPLFSGDLVAGGGASSAGGSGGASGGQP